MKRRPHCRRIVAVGSEIAHLPAEVMISVTMKHRHLVTILQEGLDEITPDKQSSANDQYLHERT